MLGHVTNFEKITKSTIFYHYLQQIIIAFGLIIFIYLCLFSGSANGYCKLTSKYLCNVLNSILTVTRFLYFYHCMYAMGRFFLVA